MLAARSPFPCHWWGMGLESVGLGAVRPDRGTYGRYDFGRLPPLPFALVGDFAWLAGAPAHRHNIGNKLAAATVNGIRILRKSADALNLRLPNSFTKFMDAPALHQRTRSATDCYIDLCPEPMRAPLSDGWLVHFLADSQGCLFWYLYLTADGSDHAVVAAPDYYSTPVEWQTPDSDDAEWDDEETDPSQIVFCAEAFEEFMCRYWLENELWFLQSQKAPMPAACRLYIERYLAQR